MQAQSPHNGAVRAASGRSISPGSERRKAPAAPKRPVRGGQAKLAMIERQIALENEKLLGHTYFQLCRTKAIGRDHLLAVVKQMYGFSMLFERLLTRRIAESSARTDERVLNVARRHLKEEFGHPDLFHDCLRRNGLSKDDLARVSPHTFLRALFGYLLATIQHENEYVGNVAIMQVMESIGFHVFGATLALMQDYKLVSTALQQHTEDDEAHSRMGLELIPSFDRHTMSASQRVIEDVYRLMHLVLDDFVGLGKRNEREGRA